MTGAVPAGESHDPECGLLYEDGTEHCTCKLLPCPFCGSENPEWVGATDGDYVWCGSCLATMPEHDPDVPDPIQRWNTRVPATPSPQPVAEVERAIAEAIRTVDADFGYSFNLTRLVDGEATHTLRMAGFDPVEFQDRTEGYALIEERRNALRAAAILSALGGRA